MDQKRLSWAWQYTPGEAGILRVVVGLSSLTHLEAWFVCQETVAPNRWLGDKVNKCQALLPAALLFQAHQSHVLSTSALDSGELRNAFLFLPGPLAGLPISRSRTYSVTCLSVTVLLEAACQEPHFIAPLTLFNLKPNMWVSINVKTNPCTWRPRDTG